MSRRGWFSLALIASGIAWLAVCVFATADVVAQGHRLDLLAVAGLLSVGLLAVTWGWLIGTRR